MAYIKLLPLWRIKVPFALSIALNFVLVFIILSWYLLDGVRHSPESGVGVARRSFNGDIVQTKCYIFVLILTTPKSYERRDTIRKTWLKLPFPKEFSFVYKFAIGVSDVSGETRGALISEYEEHNDLLFLTDLKESYHNLTLKVLKSFMWIAQHIDSKFVLKVDDDSFVRLGDLVLDLKKKEKYGRIYWGFFRGDANVKTSGPWKEPNWILCDKYLPYANGGGYVLSYDLVHYISKQQGMLQLYNSEDVSVGTWLAPVRLNRVHDVRFDTEYKSRGCNNKHIISHKQKVEDMFSKYEQLKKHNRLCKEENAKRLSFDYDWNVKPSMCCKRANGIP